jgi:hypothetical protein
LKLGSLKRWVFAIRVNKNLRDDDYTSRSSIPIFAIALSIVALVSSILMSYRGATVYLGLATDPYGRDIMVGTWVGIPIAIAGAISAYLAGQDRSKGLLRSLAFSLLVANLLIPCAWGIVVLMK